MYVMSKKYITPENRPLYGELNCPKCLEKEKGKIKFVSREGTYHTRNQCLTCGTTFIYDQSNYHPNRSPEDQKY